MAVIYISSTFEDLKAQRKAAALAIQRLGHRDIAMEKYVASNKRPKDKCLHDVGNCDAYVGIFAWRYGFIPEGYDKSITHLEYEAAKKAGIPCLIFLLDENAEWKFKYISEGEELEKIKALREELKKEHVVGFFIDAHQLEALVSEALSRQKFRAPEEIERITNGFAVPEMSTDSRLGRYVIKEKLGRGGKGVVYKVLDTLEDRLKAIKIIPPQIADSPVAFKELKGEVNNTADISHPNVVKVMGLEKYGELYFIVMQFIEGRSLEQILADGKDGKLDEKKVTGWMKQVVGGLQETHQNKVIHRDIKPANIMVTSNGKVKVLDFGISYQVTRTMTKLEGAQPRTGTWPYMAPEQLSTDFGRENEQVDVWGLGVTMYQLLTGELPFRYKEQVKDKSCKPFEPEGISRKMRAILMRCLEKDRKKRFKNMEKLLGALEKPEEEFITDMPEAVRKVQTKGITVEKNDKGYWEADYDDGIKMVYIPPGKFTMGSDENDREKPPHEVHLDGYWMGKTAVTVGQYMKFVNDAKSHYPEWMEKGSQYNIETGNDDHYKKHGAALTVNNYPIVGISWHDANAYCNWLSKKTGLKFKLPTEAQWEKAARGTDARKYPWGNDEPDKKSANFNSNVGKTSPIDSYPDGISPYGLLNMAGNVWEWCNDWYVSDYYKESPEENPSGPDSGGSGRVIRGGGWDNFAGYLCCAGRFFYGLSYRNSFLGFRLSQDN